MEVVLSTVLFGLVCAVLWKVCTFIYGYNHLCSQLRKIPHPPIHWLYGNLLQFNDSISFFKTVTTLVRNEKARMYSVWMGPIPAVGLCHPETVKQVINVELRKAQGFSDGYRFIKNWIGDGLLISEGKKWERNRKLLTPAFHFDILRGYISSMNKVSTILVSKLEQAGRDGKGFDVFPMVGKSTLDVMLRCSLSYEEAEKIQEAEDVPYITAFRRLSELLWIRCLYPYYGVDWFYYNFTSMGREERKLLHTIHAFTGQIIQRKRDILRDNPDLTKTDRHLDFLDILLTAKDSDGTGLSDQEIQDEVDTFTFEGHDTTASAISWAIYAMGKYPGIQDKVYRDVCQVMGDNSEVNIEDLSKFEYLPLFIKEVLRYYSPVPGTSRRSTESLYIDGVEIPAGVRIDINVYALHHNEEVWKDPGVFDPERFYDLQRDESTLYRFIPFSAGSRNCIGQNFAMNEIKITLAKVVKRFEISVDGLEEPALLPDIIMRSVHGVHINVKVRG